MGIFGNRQQNDAGIQQDQGSGFATPAMTQSTDGFIPGPDPSGTGVPPVDEHMHDDVPQMDYILTDAPTTDNGTAAPQPQVFDQPAEMPAPAPEAQPAEQPFGEPVPVHYAEQTDAPAPETTAQPAEQIAETPSQLAPTNDTLDELADIKRQALQQLSPLVGHLDQSPEERFRTSLMLLQSTDDKSFIRPAYEAAQAITDEKARAQALLEIINEVDYFSNK